jgi:serine/threonine protein kinase
MPLGFLMNSFGKLALEYMMSVDISWLYENFNSLSKITPLPGGGQKWVFQCLHTVYGPCVLKLIKPGATRYLDRELEAVSRLGQLPSVNVPEIFEYGTISSQVGNLVFLFEEYIDGTDLFQMLRQGHLTRGQLLRLASDLVSIVKDAESVSVVHRDIKPMNIKIDSEGKAWLLDFGIARILDLESKTRTDSPVGPHSPGYSAPEQFRYQKRQIDGRSDLFAIGVVLHESAIGVNLFINGARDRAEILRRVLSEPLPHLNLEWDTGGHFAQFVSSLAQKYPYQRPASCAEAADWLAEIIERLGGL